jgi:hypothetical protein
MKTYLSYGGGVNSTAMMLLLLDEGWEFESVFVDTGAEYPETLGYVTLMQNKGFPVTILTPAVLWTAEWNSLYDYCEAKHVVPSTQHRWCTKAFKIETIQNYIQTPCFMLIGFDTDEAHRAKPSCSGGVENRWPLLEYEVSRKSCEIIIKAHSLPIPRKSGCFICPFQKRSQWIRQRREHPELFCQAKKLEDACVEKQIRRGRKPFYINKVPLETVVSENQIDMWPDQKPPCNCGL